MRPHRPQGASVLVVVATPQFRGCDGLQDPGATEPPIRASSAKEAPPKRRACADHLGAKSFRLRRTVALRRFWPASTGRSCIRPCVCAVHFAAETGWPPAEPDGDGARPGPVSPGWCAGSVVGAETRGSPGTSTPGRSGRGRAGCVGCCDPHTSCHARSIVQQANRTLSTTQRPCVTSTSRTRHRKSPTGPHSAVTSLFAYSSDHHSLGARELSTDPSRCQSSAGGGETPAHRISRAARDSGR